MEKRGKKKRKINRERVRSAKSSWNISAISRRNAPFLRGRFSSAQRQLAYERRAAPSTTGSGLRRVARRRARCRGGRRARRRAGPNLKRGFRDRGSGRGRERDRGHRARSDGEIEACGRTEARIPSVARDPERATFRGGETGSASRVSCRPAHTYLRVPSIARIVQNHAPTIAGPQCTAVACENCDWGKRAFRAITRAIRLIGSSVRRRDGYYRVWRARTGCGHGFAHFASRRDISRAYAGED